MTRDDLIADALVDIGSDPVAMHLALFAHRHNAASPKYHSTLIKLYHSEHPRVMAMVFRGGAKSTIAEETICTKACLRQFHNCLIIGETEPRAIERLTAIKRELEGNLLIETLFGSLQGPVWGATKIELSNGVVIQALGRGQSLRGVKHLEHRPDFLFMDDLEDEESVLTELSRQKTKDWYWKTVVPALADPVHCPIRGAATPLHEEALAVELSRLGEYTTLTVPIESVSATGERQASWPDKYPLPTIDKLKDNFAKAGRLDAFMQEYMCQTHDPTTRVFAPSMFVYDPARVRAYEPVYAVYDPARSVRQTSAFTGVVVASWSASRLVVWSARARLWHPDEIISDMFAVDDEFKPIAIGVEEDGLNEFIMQPLRHAQIERGHPLPIRPLKAPKGKLDFIRALQPFFRAKEVIFAGQPDQFNELTTQLLNFGATASAKIDAVNALAYFLKMRPGRPVYEGFDATNVAEELYVTSSPVYLAVNSDGRHTTAVTLQLARGEMRVLADDIREGEPADTLFDLVSEAREYANTAGFSLKLYAPPQHFSAHDSIGLRAAAARVPIICHKGGPEAVGRGVMQDYLSRRTKGFPSLRVVQSAHWTLRAFTGGYARALNKDGTLTNEPQEGAYKTLMQAVESLLALRSSRLFDDDDMNLKYDYTAQGRKFISART